MRKHGTTIIIFALASFYFLTTDIILTDETAGLWGEEKAILVYALAMLSLGAGFALFSFLHQKTSTVFNRKLLLSLVFLISGLLLPGFVLVHNPFFFLLFSLTHMLATGVIGGAAHFYTAMALRDRSYSGRVIGSAIGMAALLQVILLMGTSSSLLRVLMLIVVLAAVFYLVLWKTPVATAI